MTLQPERARAAGAAVLASVALAFAGVGAGAALAQATSSPTATAGPAWSALTTAQQHALAPLRPTWESTNGPSKLKWLEVADRFPRMPADERSRVQERMAAWAAMSPSDRARARVQFQETRRIGAEERQARWQAYQALPEDERKRLAMAAKKPVASPTSASAAAARTPTKVAEASSAKRNIVAATPVPTPRTVTPTVVQAKPGASTTTVTTRAKPPLHHQPGLPKIVATPNFVDPTTLLPKRGAQAAAMRTVSSSDPTQQP